MQLKWEVDDSNLVDLTIGGFAKPKLFVNGNEVQTRLTLRKKNESTFELSNSRRATISIKPQFGGAALVNLYVDGQLMVPTGKTPITCSSCGTVAKPNDRFCSKCGQAMPSAESYVHQKQLKEATSAIWMLAVLFLGFGILMFFVTLSQSNDVLAKIAGMDANSQFPRPINGVTYTVAALRARLSWEPWGVLIVNMILAAAMAILAFWGKKAPLAAILIALAIYAVVVVTNATIDPATIAQGVILKIIVVLLLYRGVSGALALRSANA